MAFSCRVESALAKVDLTDDRRPIRVVDDHEVVGGHGAQAHRIGRIRLVHPVPPVLGAMDEPLLGEQAEDRDARSASRQVTERLVVGKWKLERRALHVVEQDM